MEIKVLSVLLCALILLWAAQELHGYTSPFVHGKGGQSGKKKKSEIWQKNRMATGLPSTRSKVCMTARMLGCDKEYRREEILTI
ncbi:hypothetical protein OS493_008275 [Desmophyllum pertusum]|uniref:Uncharacterized protein n=1 Tax=Desmophyllum pertusum TaxID=174260 RepID=A0A9X0DA69_9CNID|nr:hypothetical protein OS493_008275 [Desmophyllum pertusum]